MARARRKRKPEVAAPVPVPEVPVTLPDDPYAEFADHDWGFAWPLDAEPEVVDERALHAVVKQWRHGRATRSVWDVLNDAYIAIFSVVMIGAMVINVIVTSQNASSACETAACLNGRMLVPWGLYFGLSALVVSSARLFGPVLASSAEGFWLLGAPISRRPVLVRRLWAPLAGAALVAAALTATVTGIAGEPLTVVLAWSAASGLTASGLVAWAAWEQSHDRVRALRVLQAVLAAAAAVTLLLMIAVAVGMIHIDPPAWLGVVPWVLAAAGAVAALAFAIGAHRRLEDFSQVRLTSGGSLVSGLQGAMFALDLGLARDILVDREAIARGHVHPVRGRGTGARAVMWREAQRLVRFPRPLLGLAGAALAPYASDAIGLAVATPFIAAVALMVALIPTLGTLRVLSRTRGLARTFPMTTGDLRVACTAVPAALAVVWAAATVPAFAGVVSGTPRDIGIAAAMALACAMAGLGAAVRWQNAKQVDFGVPMMATGAGALPPTLVFNLVRGFDVAALVTAPLLLGATPLWSLGIGVAVLTFMRAGINWDELSEEAKENRNELEAVKARRR
ncbi:MAG: ABC transporter permease [Nigerium sp.]|nr:ABC transporter permease [Nigerium sp.]